MALLAYRDPQLLLRVRSLRLWRVESMDVSGEAAIIKLLAVIVRVKDCDWVLFEGLKRKKEKICVFRCRWTDCYTYIIC